LHTVYLSIHQPLAVVLVYHEPGKNTAFGDSIFFNQQEASQYSTNGRLAYLVLGMFIDHHDEKPPSLFIREDLVREFSIITPVCVTSSLFVVCAAWLPSEEQHL
jgi:hypothetical protein